MFGGSTHLEAEVVSILSLLESITARYMGGLVEVAGSYADLPVRILKNVSIG